MNDNALSDLVAIGKESTTEFRCSGTSGLGRELCAFVNVTGVTNLPGVSNEGETCGFADMNRLQSEVQSIARSTEPLIDVSENRAMMTFARLFEHAADRKIRHATPQVPGKYPSSFLTSHLTSLKPHPLLRQ